MEKFVKPISKKALKAGISHAGDRVGKQMVEQSGDLIMRRLRNLRKEDEVQKTIAPILKKVMTTQSPMKNQQQKESTDMIINRLISGSGKRRR